MYQYTGIQRLSKSQKSTSFSLTDTNVDVFQYTVFSKFVENVPSVTPPDEEVIAELSSKLGQSLNANDILQLGGSLNLGQKKILKRVDAKLVHLEPFVNLGGSVGQLILLGVAEDNEKTPFAIQLMAYGNFTGKPLSNSALCNMDRMITILNCKLKSDNDQNKSPKLVLECTDASAIIFHDENTNAVFNTPEFKELSSSKSFWSFANDNYSTEDAFQHPSVLLNCLSFY